MKITGTCRVVDALGEWGTHNTQWRAGREITDAAEGVDFVLTYYSDLVCRILAASPFGCVRARIFAEDLPQLICHDSIPAAERQRRSSRRWVEPANMSARWSPRQSRSRGR